MNPLMIRSLNTPLLIAIVLVGIGIQTSFFSFYPLNYLQPDLILFLVIWMSFKRSWLEGGILTLLFAEIAEIHSSGTRGLYFVTYMTIYMTLRVMNKLLLFRNFQSLIGVTLFSSVLWKISSLILLYFLGYGAQQWKHTLSLLLPGALMQGVLGIWVYRLLEKIDWVTMKDPRARDAMRDEAILMEDSF